MNQKISYENLIKKVEELETENTLLKSQLQNSLNDKSKISFNKFSIETIIENLPFVSWLKNIEGQFVYVNFLYCQSINKSFKEIIGKTDVDLYPEKLAEQFLTQLAKFSSI